MKSRRKSAIGSTDKTLRNTIVLRDADRGTDLDNEIDDASQQLDDSSYRLQHLQYLNLLDRPQSVYTDHNYGPVKPGFDFYKWLFVGAPLRLPIAETVLIEKDLVRVLRSNESSDGTITREIVKFSEQTDRDEFVHRCLQNFVIDSKPMGQFPQSASLRDRYVAVLKKPSSRPESTVSNSCELLIPEYFHALLVEALDSKSHSLVLQKLIKSRGSKSGVYRVFWRATDPGACPSGTVEGWLITKGAGCDFTAFERDGSSIPHCKSGAVAMSTTWRNMLTEELDSINKAFIEDMTSKLDMSLSDRALAVRMGSMAHKHGVDANLVSLGNRAISSSVVEGIATSRVQRKALEEVRMHIETLVLWLQNTLYKQESLVFHLSDVVCDFIRDDDGKWWFIQMKGFNVNPPTIARCNTWFKYKQSGNVHALLKKRHLDNQLVRRKLEMERGLKCKTCGLNFQVDQTVDIETGVDIIHEDAPGLDDKKRNRSRGTEGVRRPKTAGSPSTATATKTSPNNKNHFISSSKYSKRNVPAFGYELSRRMACRLSELYRDCDFQLTKFSRAVLVGTTAVADARTVADKFRDQEMLELSRSTGGELACCFFCHQIVEEYSKVAGLCRDLSERLRVGNKISTFGTITAQRSIPASPSTIRSKGVDFSPSTPPKSASRGVRVRDIDGGFTLEPWRSQHFKRGTHQFRLIVMAHYLADAEHLSNHQLHGGLGIFSYELGQTQCRMPFHAVLENGERVNHPVVRIHQSRLHYFCGTTADVRSFLATKKLRFEVGVAPRDLEIGPSALGAEQILGNFTIDLSKLTLANTTALDDGSEKIDYLVSVHLDGVGEVKAKVSVAVVRDKTLPWQIVEVASLLKEQQVFWPASDYWDHSYIPPAWLEMLASGGPLKGGTSSDCGPCSTETATDELDPAVDTHQADLQHSHSLISKHVKALVIIDSDEEDDAQNLLDRKKRHSDAGLHEVTHLARAIFSRMVDEKTELINDSDTTAKGTSSKGRASESNDSEDDEDDKFGEEEVGNKSSRSTASSSDGSEYDYDDKLKTYSFINAVFSELKSIEEAGKLRAHDEDGEDIIICKEGYRPTEGHILMRLALEQLLQENHLPAGVTWTDFQSLLTECISWAKTQRSKLKIAKRSDGRTMGTPAAPTNTGPATNTVAESLAVSFSKVWIKDADQRLQQWQSTSPKSALDFSYSKNELLIREKRGLISGAGLRKNYLLQPSSIHRKKRRLLTALAVFELASGGGDTMSIAALEQYVSRERTRLLRFVSLVNEGEAPLPHIQMDYVQQMCELPFSFTRALLCCHFLSSSEQFRTLCDEIKISADNSEIGGGLISSAGFVRAVEEAHFNVTNHLNENSLLGETDQVLSELMILATEDQMTLMNSESHAYRRRSTFSLGLSEFMDDKSGGINVDLGSIASRRRSSKLTELSNNSNKRGNANDSPPFIYLTCDYHGVEKFFLADICCCACEKSFHQSEEDRGGT